MIKKISILICTLSFFATTGFSQNSDFINTSYVSTGVWMPTGKLNTLGNHPFIGISFGGQQNKFLLNLVIDMRFMKSKNYYEFNYMDSIHVTNDFFGGYMGVDVGYEMLRTEKSSFNLIGGFGYDGFDALFPEAWEGNEAATHSYNLNFGLLYKYYFKGTKYLGIQTKFNLIDNTLQDRTDLTGNAFTIAILYCLAKDSSK